MNRGIIELITGPMFSGKSTELIRRAKRLGFAGYKVQCFKPMIDNRYHESHIASHDNVHQKAHSVKDTKHLLELLETDTEVIVIDEIQFFDEKILHLCEKWASMDRHVIVSGLLLDCFGRPFTFLNSDKNMLHLISMADTVDTLHAICTHKDYDSKICGRPGTRTQRFMNGKAISKGELVVVGGMDSYAPRCRKHFVSSDDHSEGK